MEKERGNTRGKGFTLSEGEGGRGVEKWREGGREGVEKGMEGGSKGGRKIEGRTEGGES